MNTQDQCDLAIPLGQQITSKVTEPYGNNNNRLQHLWKIVSDMQWLVIVDNFTQNIYLINKT